MKLIRPIAVTDSVLVSTNVVETAPTAYAGGTTYAAGAQASVAAGTVLSVYTSLQAGNIGHTPASSPTWWALTGTTYATYSGGTTYGLGDIVISVSTNYHHAFQSLAAGNIGNALTVTTQWLDLGQTNRWAMFDTSITSQATNPNSIAATFVVPGRCDSVALLNVSAASARVTMTDAIDGVVFDKTFSMVSDSGITDWYSYFFEPIDRIGDLAITGLPPYSNATITVTLTDAGATVACGALIFGLSKEIGATQYGAKVGIQDYSVKSQDVFGNYNVTKRAFNKYGNFTVWVDNTYIDRLQAILADYRAIPIVYLGSDAFTSTLIYGFYKVFAIEITMATQSICTIEIEGLT